MPLQIGTNVGHEHIQVKWVDKGLKLAANGFETLLKWQRKRIYRKMEMNNSLETHIRVLSISAFILNLISVYLYFENTAFVQKDNF